MKPFSQDAEPVVDGAISRSALTSLVGKRRAEAIARLARPYGKNLLIASLDSLQMADLVLVKPKGPSLIPDARTLQKDSMTAEAAEFTHVSLYVGSFHCLEINGYSLWPGAASRVVPMPLDSPRQEICILRRRPDAYYNEQSRLQIVVNAYSTHAIKRPRYAYFRAGLYYILSKIPGLKFEFNNSDDSSVICSKFIFNALNDAGFLREEDTHARRAEPLPGNFFDWPEFEKHRLTYWKLED